MRRDRTPLPGHVHPSETAYKAGCGCEKCRDMRTRRDKHRAARVLRTGPAMIEVAPVIQSLRRWTDEGFSLSVIAALTGVEDSRIVNYAAGGTQRMNSATARLLLGVTREGLYRAAGDRCYVPAIGASRRVGALSRIGWTRQAMREASGVSISTLGDVAQMRGKSVTAGAYRGIAVAYDRLSMTPGGNDICVGMAARLGYPPPLCWDDDTIDDPAAEPDYGQPEPTRAELDAIMRKLYDQGMNDAQIGEAVGRSRDTVRHWRNRRAGGLPAIEGTAVALGDERDDRLALWQQGLTDREIADRIGRHPDVARRWRNRHGLESRTNRKRKEAA